MEKGRIKEEKRDPFQNFLFLLLKVMYFIAKKESIGK